MFCEFRCGTASVHSFPLHPLVECSAYLTNPSETSFRAYLTEQSFRLHLSHLDDHLDDKTDAQTQPVHSTRPGPPGSAAYRPSGGDHLAASFHFAKRASVSLRTPKHVFHNFGICTIAAMMPIGKTPGRICNTTSYHLRDRDASLLIADSWYIGAFGRWWRGGVIEAWYRDLIARSSDEESWSSGILGIKSLDKFNNDCNGTCCGRPMEYFLSKAQVCRLPRRPENQPLKSEVEIDCKVAISLGAKVRRHCPSQSHFHCTRRTKI